VKLKKCLSAITAGAVTISAIAVAQFVSADGGVDAAAAEAFWGSDYNMAETQATEFTYHFDENLGGIVVTDYLGSEPKVRIPEQIDGSPVLEVDLSACMYNFKALMIPDTANEVSLATYNSLLEYYKTYAAAPITDFEFYYDKEIKGVVITDYKKDSPIVKIPEKVKMIDVNDSSKVSEYTVKKIDLTDSKKEFKALVVPDADEIIVPNHEDVTICIAHLNSTVNRSSSGKDVSKYPYTNIGVEKVNVPAELDEVDTGVFSGCMIRDVYIPDSHSDIGKWAFSDCYMLANVTIGSQDAIIDDGAFRNCYALKSVNIVNINSIGEWAFSGCANLTDVTLSDDLTTIGKGAFSRCLAIENITIPASVETIGTYAFNGCESLQTITVAEGNNDYVTTEDGVLFNADMTELLRVPEGTSISQYTIPDSVSYIANSAFRNCDLDEIIIPEGVSQIDNSAFENCGCGTVKAPLILPDSISTVEPGAFEGCSVINYKGTVYKSKSSTDEYDMSKTFTDLYVDINTALF